MAGTDKGGKSEINPLGGKSESELWLVLMTDRLLVSPPGDNVVTLMIIALEYVNHNRPHPSPPIPSLTSPLSFPVPLGPPPPPKRVFITLGQSVLRLVVWTSAPMLVSAGVVVIHTTISCCLCLTRRSAFAAHIISSITQGDRPRTLRDWTWV